MARDVLRRAVSDQLSAISFERVRDFALIREFVTAPGAWDAATDDGARDASVFAPHEDERVFYVLATRPTDCIAFREAVSLYTLIPQNAVCYEIHATRAFGRSAAEASRGIFAWAFAHTPARRIVASIPATNRIAIRAAERAGMTRYGINERSFLKRGALIDQVLLGISSL